MKAIEKKNSFVIIVLLQVLNLARKKKIRNIFTKKSINVKNLAFFSIIISALCIIPIPSVYAVSYTFSSPFLNLSNTATGSAPQIAVNGSDIHVVWSDTTTGSGDIYYERSTDGGVTFNGGTSSTPGTPINLSSNTGASTAPQITVSGSNVYVVWKDTTTGSGDIYYERSTDGGVTFNGGTSSTPGTPINLSSNAGASTAPQITVSRSNVYVVWSDTTTPSGIYFSRSTDGGATFNGGTSSTPGSPTVLSSTTGTTATPQLAASGSNVTVVWRGSTPGSGAIYYESSTNSGSSFNTVTSGAAINLSSGVSGAPTVPQVTMSGPYVHVVWQQGTTADIYYSRSINGGVIFNGGTSSTPGTPINLSSNAGASNFPKIAVSSSNVYVVWQDKTVDASGDIYFSVSNDNGTTFNGGTSSTPGSPVNISASSGVTSTTPVVAATSTVVHVVWQESGTTSGKMYYTRGATSSLSVSLDQQQYTLSNTATLTVTSPSSPPATTIQATVKSTTDATGISVTLAETGTNTGIYTKQFTFTTGSSSGTSLHASPGDTITATFNSQSGTASIYSRTVAFGFASYTMSSTAGITVTDQNSVTNPSNVETIQITVSSTSTPSGVPLTLTETGAGTGVFTSSNLIFTNGSALFHIGDTATITQTETSGGHLTDNTIDTLTVSVTSTSDSVGITMTLTETKVNTGSFAAHLAFTSGSSFSSSTSNAIKVANGDVVSVTYLGETSHGLIIPNPNSGLNALPAKIDDTITASYLGSKGTAIINPGSGGGGGGGGLLRPGLVLDVVLTELGGGAPSSPPVFFNPSSIPVDSLPQNIKNSILYPDPTKPILPLINSQIDTPLTIDNEGFILPLHANTISTVTESTGKPFHLKLRMQDPYEITHVSFFTNLPGQTSQITDSDTAIIYDKDKPFMILDPHHVFSNVTMAATANGDKYTFDYTITFAKPMKKSDIYIRSWNSLLSSSDQDILDALQVNASANPPVLNKTINSITSPIVNATTPTQNAVSNMTAKPDVFTAIKEWGGYSPTSISDKELLNTIGVQGEHIPSWFMQTTKWLVDGNISQDDFINAIKYMQQMKIVK